MPWRGVYGTCPRFCGDMLTQDHRHLVAIVGMVKPHMLKRLALDLAKNLWVLEANALTHRLGECFGHHQIKRALIP